MIALCGQHPFTHQSTHRVDKVASPTSESGIGHCHNNDMLLDVELPRVQVGLHPEERDLLVWHHLRPADAHWICDQLDDVWTDVNDGVAQEEQSIDTGDDRSQDHADHPGTDGAGWQVLVVVADDSAHLTPVIS